MFLFCEGFLKMRMCMVWGDRQDFWETVKNKKLYEKKRFCCGSPAGVIRYYTYTPFPTALCFSVFRIFLFLLSYLLYRSVPVCFFYFLFLSQSLSTLMLVYLPQTLFLTYFIVQRKELRNSLLFQLSTEWNMNQTSFLLFSLYMKTCQTYC